MVFTLSLEEKIISNDKNKSFYNLNQIKNPKKDIVILAIFSILILITRIPFMSKYLYEWDSVNYALGFEKYDILSHQPHSPGYILYIGLGKLVNFIFSDANTTMIVISIVFSILTVILVYYLAKDIFSMKIAIIASIFLIFNPIFWFYGEIATIYPSEAFFATLIAFLSYKVFKGNEKFFYLSAIALGIAGGFRQDLIIFMLPLWLFCLYFSNKSIKKVLKAFAVLIPSVLLWFIPTIVLTGGYDAYITASGHFSTAFESTSILLGASLFNQLIMNLALFSWLILATGIIGTIFLIFYIIKERKDILSQKFIKNPIFVFMLLWILPMLLFQILFPLSKPGYSLIYISAISLIIGYLFNYIALKINSKYSYSYKSVISGLLIIFVLINSIYFLYPSNLDVESTWETPMNIMDQNQKILLGIDILFLYNYEKIHKNDINTEYHIKTILNSSNPQNSTIIIRDTLREDQGFSWRKAIYYLPQYDIYYISDDENSGLKSLKTHNYFIISYGKDHKTNRFENETLDIPLNSSTKQIIWVMNDKTEFFNKVDSKLNITSFILPNGLKIYYSDIKSNANKNLSFLT